jgi:thiol-disulfide isomerase/thioredoxin
LRTRPKALAALLLTPLLLASHGSEPLALVDLDGAPVRLAREEGAVVAHFWATWCSECVAELPALASAAQSCADRPVRVVAINVGESAEAIVRYRAEHPFDLPVLRDPGGKVFRRFARGLPANLIWTGAGRRTDTGLRSEAAWRKTLAELGCAPAP